jgi:hypothetical protein
MVIVWLGDPVLLTAIRGGLALLLATAGLHKVRDGLGFAVVLRSYGVLAHGLIRPVSRLLPWVELAAAVLLAHQRPLSALLVATILLVYALVMAVSLMQGRRIADCGCQLGSQRVAVSWPLVWRNLILAVLALILLLPSSNRALGFYDGLVLAGVLGCGCLLYLLANSLIANHRSAQELSL